ncbi:hypothetical protein GCM10009816_05290 [Microbacterium aquimaris]
MTGRMLPRLIGIVCLSGLVVFGTAGATLDAAGEPGGLTVLAPEQVTAGEAATVTVTGAGERVEVTVAGSLGTTTFPRETAGGTVAVEIPAKLTRIAGLTTIFAVSDGEVAVEEVRIVPGEVASVQTIVGARSIVADADDVAMAVALPVDIWGNAVADGTSIDFFRVHPDGESETTPREVDDLLAFTDLFSGTVAGRNAVWSRLADVQSITADLDEVAGPPLPFSLGLAEPEGSSHVADGRALLHVRTGPLADAFGNVLADGTAVDFRWEGPDGSGSARALTIAGQAETWIQSPARPGTVTIAARSKGVEAASTLTVATTAALETFPAQASLQGGILTVHVGPARAEDGALLPDGAVVTVSAGDIEGEGFLEDGEAVLTLAVGDLDPAQVRVDLLGAAVSVAVEQEASS